jgi:hypothetical protein
LPIPSTTTKRSWDPRDFLSIRIASSSCSNPTSSNVVGSPTREKALRCRATSSADSFPDRAASSATKTQPIATASPWRTWYAVASSIA